MSTSPRTPRRPAQQAGPALPALPALGGAWTLAALAASLASAGAGLALWIAYAPQAEPRLRRLGWIFGALALIGGLVRNAAGDADAERWIRPYY